MSSSNAINKNNVNKNYLKLAQLHNSSHEFYLDDMKMFLNKDFDINYALSFDSQVQHEKAQKWLGYTALHFAVDIKAKDHKSIINLLLKHGADFTRKNNEGLTPLHLLLKKYLTTSAVHRDSCKTLFNPLLFAHVNFNNVTNPCCRNEISHLHIAIIADNLQVTKFFLDAGISVNETISVDSSSFPGYSCLHLAMANENKEMVKMLLKYNADPVCLNSDGLSPLHLVIKKHLTDVTLIGCRKKQESKLFNNENIMDLLIESLKKKNCLPRFMGLTELHVYCAKYQTCKPEILQKMLDQNIDLNASVNDDSPIWQGYTPLHFAAHCNLQTVLLLAKKGANLLAKNMNGITPLDICLQKYYLGNTIDILKTQDEFKSIEFNDGQNLIDVLTYFKSLDKLYKHLNVTNNVNNAIPMESPLWPGYTLLHIAVKVCSTQADGKVVQICLKHGADITIQDANKMTALHLAHHLKHKQCALEILSCHQDILTNPVDQNNISHFHVSISVPGQSELGQKFLKNGVDLNEVVKMDTFWQFIRGTISKQYAVIPKGSTLLHFAVATLCRWLVRYLLENNANPYVLDADGLTWLHRAFDNENFKWLRYTVWQKDKALESNPVAPGGLSHFHVACLCGNLKSVRALLLMTPNINEPITSDLMKCIKKLPEDVCLGDTPLHLAVKAQSQNVIEFLLKAGADQTAKNDKGLNSLQVALEMKSSKAIINLFTSKFYEKHNWTDDTGLTLLHIACATKDEAKIEILLKKVHDANSQIKSDSPIWPNETPLNIVAKEFIVDHFHYSKADSIVKLFLNHILRSMESSVPTNQRSRESKKRKVAPLSNQSFVINQDGLSAFHLSCMGSDSDIVEKFLKFGADINAQNDCFSSNNAGYTPLHFAVQFGRQSIVEVLLKYGADINIENCNGYTPLHLAVSKRLKFVNIFLREREVDLSVKNSFNQTFADVLLKNMEEFNEDFVECSMNILRCGAAKNANFSTKTLLINLLLNNFGTPTLKKLIGFIPNLSETDSQRRTIMHHCLKQYYNLFQNYRGRLADKIEILLENGIPLDQQDRCGRTPLHYAGLCYKNLEHVVTFLNLGADINVIDSEGHTPYTCCFKNVYDTHTPIVEKYHEHIAKIEAAGLYLHPLNRERKRRNSYLYGEYSYVLDEKAMDRVIYDSLRLRDLLTEEIVLNFTMMTPSKREFIKKFLRSKSLHEEFAEWSALFNLQYRKMLERQSLWGSAVESLYESLDRKLPKLCLECILQYFSTDDLKNVVCNKRK